MLSDGPNAFTWNARNQVAKLNNVSLQYDAFGRRIQNASGTSFLYDGANTAQEFSGSTNNPTNSADPTGLDGWTSFWGGVRCAGGAFEAVAGFGLGAATSWTGIGAIAGGAVGLHGLDQAQAGCRQLFTGCSVDSFTSQGLQGIGLSPRAANLADAGISVLGSFGAGAATQGLAASASASDAMAGLSNAQKIIYYEIGQKTLSASQYAKYGQIVDPVERGMQIVADQGWVQAILPDLGGVSQYGATIPQGLTPLARGGAVAVLGGLGTGVTAGRKDPCHQ